LLRVLTGFLGMPSHGISPEPGQPPYADHVRVQISQEAAQFARANGGQVWVWADRQACCGALAWMHAATKPPKSLSGFVMLDASGTESLDVYFRAVGGQWPEVLEIGLEGRRRPKIAAYWDGCLMAMA
jgi:hypothetical protein